MGQALYRKYRSKKLSELVGQEHITTALDRALKKGTIAHAYLFTGPRGTGKTSIARILAHEVNSLPYEDEANHLDIIEIDAASNRRIDEIRDLRDKVYTAPASAKFKVYIIDEVHMLTKEAFNALLKTLEEPPAHVIFVLATTEAHKLPDTIISRTQRFSFKPVDADKVVAHLKHIAKQENITISDEALELIAAHGEGSFRDSISLLDQTRNSGDKVTLADVQMLLGIAPEKRIEELLQAVHAHDAVAIAQHVQSLADQGFAPAQVAKQLGVAMRQAVISGSTPHGFDALSLLSKLVDVPASPDPHASLEIALFDAAFAGAPNTTPKAAPPTPKVTSQAAVETKPAVQIEPHPSTVLKKHKAQTEETAETHQTTDLLDAPTWANVLGALKKQYNTLYSVARMAQPRFEPGQVTLECGFAFHKKQLNNSKNKQILIDTIQEVSGLQVNVSCTVRESDAAASSPQLPPAAEQVHKVEDKKPNDTAVKSISNIFGGAELLES